MDRMNWVAKLFGVVAGFGLLGFALLLQHTASEELTRANQEEVNRPGLRAVPQMPVPESPTGLE